MQSQSLVSALPAQASRSLDSDAVLALVQAIRADELRYAVIRLIEHEARERKERGTSRVATAFLSGWLA